MITVNTTKNFDQIAGEMKILGMKLPPNRIRISVPGAKAALDNALSYFLSQEGRVVNWLPEYDEVARWLTDNTGRGLFLYGKCGRGKSLLCRYALPAILLKHLDKVTAVYDVQEMNRDLDTLLTKHIIAIDDIGTEEMCVKYGEKRLAFGELMDAAEKYGKLVIVSTNLNQEELRERYGDRVMDRIRSTMCRVLFDGDSLRK